MLAKRLLSSVAISGSSAFVPFDSAIYAVRQGSRSSPIALFRVTYDPGTATLTFGPTILRPGMLRVLHGLPVRSSLDKVTLFGRDFIAAPVAASADPSTDYPDADGPKLPYSLAQLSAATTTITGELSVKVNGSASANGGLSGTTSGNIKIGKNSAITITSTTDTSRFAPSASDISQAAAILANDAGAPHTVAVNGGAATAYLGIVPTTGYTQQTTNSTSAVTSLKVDGTAVANLTTYPATSWWNDFTGTQTFSGTITAGPHTMTWRYTTQWTGFNILQYIPSTKRYTPWTSDPTRSGSVAYGWNLVVGTTIKTADYSLVLPTAPSVVNDDPVTLGLYDLAALVVDAPSSTIDASAYYAETYDTYESYTPIVPANALGGVQPALPKDSTTASVPWFKADPRTPATQSDKFTLPTGKLVKALSLVARDWQAYSGAFAPYAQANVSAASAATANIVPAITDTCGTRLVSAIYSISYTYSFLVEDPEAKTSFSLAVAAAAYRNVGDAVLWYTTDATQEVLYPTVFSKTPPVDAFAQQGTASGSITYALDPTLLYTPTSVPFMWTLDPVPEPVGISGVPSNGLDPLYDAPADALNVARSVTMTPGAPFYLGQRNGVAFFAVTGTSTWSEMVPISSIGTLQEATQTWQGQTVKRVGIKQSSRSFAGFVGVSGGVATVYPVSGATGISYYDVGQVVDGTGKATGTYVSWSKPGQAWSRSNVAYGGSVSYGKAATLLALYSAAGKDWMLVTGGRSQLDLSATMRTPGAAANLQSIVVPSAAASFTASLVPHLGGLMLTSNTSTPGYLSLDAGATWLPITVAGTQVGADGTDAPSTWPGQPLFAY